MKTASFLPLAVFAALACSSSSAFAQSLPRGDAASDASPKCGVDVICLPESIMAEKRAERAHREKMNSLDRDLDEYTLRASIQEQKDKIQDEAGESSSSPVRVMNNVPNPSQVVGTSSAPSSEVSSSSLDDVSLQAVFNEEKATFSVGGNLRDARVGERVSGYELVSLDFDTARLKGPGQEIRTLHVNW